MALKLKKFSKSTVSTRMLVVSALKAPTVYTTMSEALLHAFDSASKYQASYFVVYSIQDHRGEKIPGYFLMKELSYQPEHVGKVVALFCVSPDRQVKPMIDHRNKEVLEAEMEIAHEQLKKHEAIYDIICDLGWLAGKVS